MHTFLFDPNLIPFHMSLIILVIVSMVETLGYYLNIKTSYYLKSCFPRYVLRSKLIDIRFSKILILIFLLLNFSVAGYILEWVAFAKFHIFVPFYYIIIPAIIISIFFTVFMIHCLDQVIKPRFDKKNINLIGCLATVSSGNARPGFSAQARVRDQYGQLHYIQVEPEFGELELQAQILLIKQHKSYYIAKRISRSNHILNHHN
ncbi:MULTISPECIES: OB-fold-containig protein [unclassified Acinetobacter]|uniref:OB-fold-containig protein n=1 Tax=unclassified Acinetobacter TaxID=196816 RepID=UPI0029351023|nr:MULTISPECIES: OB-fold-containig protein [unclassified Acinetobacter]WOE32120.1 DUF1449 family protein [Acinetobacter sp. SAAs470]WOE37589.1 DUF1449 family protein [Acinetobacter sp. SAAs474]